MKTLLFWTMKVLARRLIYSAFVRSLRKVFSRPSARHEVSAPQRILLEELEPRLLCSVANPAGAMPGPPLIEPSITGSASTLRIVTYNIEDDINGNTTPLPGLYQVLEGIGEEEIQGNARPIDILGLEETTSNADVEPIVTNLNTYYNGAAVYAESPYQATQSGSNADGNGPNALVYNSSTLNLLASVGVGTPEGSGNGEYRQVVRYEFQPVGDTGSNGVFYIYVSHMKSGTGSTNANDRAEEATIIRNDEATLPANSSVIYMGDLNSNPPEAEFTIFTGSGQGQANDPVNFSSSVQYYSESATDLRYRDDYELPTLNILGGTGAINYINGSFHVFGNNGTTPVNGSVDSGSNTSLNSDLVQDGGAFISASTLYADLTTASDHLPAVADYSYTLVTAPTVTSPTVTGITLTSATLGGDATSDGGATITKRGVLYALTSVNSNPTLGGTGVTELNDSSGGTGIFTENATGLTSSSEYSFVAFATNSVGTSYTSPVSNFTTYTPIAVSSIVTNRGTSPIIGTSVSGNIVTVTLAGNATYTAGASVLIANSSVAADNGAFTIASGASNSNSFTYIDNNDEAANATGGTATVVGGTGSLGENASGGDSQRSMVDSIVYTFNQAVNLGSGAITLAPATISSGPSGNPLPTVNYASPDEGFTWIITFSGSSTQFNSILDGAYQMTLNAADVTLLANSNIALGSNNVQTFYRLYGDAAGVAANGGKVNTADYANLLNSINVNDNSASFPPWADIDGNSKIDTFDYAVFLNQINEKFTGFTPTI